MTMSPMSYSWVNPKLEVGHTLNYGRGLFAKDIIIQSEMLIVWGGIVIPATQEQGDNGIQITESLVLLDPTGNNKLGADFVNHSCDPNAGFRGQIILIALRQISPGEEITFDYAMCLHPVPGLPRYEFNCACEKPICRKVITENDWLIPDLQARYTGYFQPFLQDKINKTNRAAAT